MKDCCGEVNGLT